MISTYMMSPNQIFILDQNDKCNNLFYIRSNLRNITLIVIFVIILVWGIGCGGYINVLSSFLI